MKINRTIKEFKPIMLSFINLPTFAFLVFLTFSCRQKPTAWSGVELTQPRQSLTVDELVAGKSQP